ncbi:MAG TPA: hypothetical protein VIO58_09960 [Candidatus Methanoperedens sp.]
MKIKYMGLITGLFLAVAAIIFLLSSSPQTLGNSLEYTDQKSDEYIEPAPADTSPALPRAQATPSETPSGNPSTSGNSLPSGSSLSKPEISLSQTETQPTQPQPSGTSFTTTNIQTTQMSSINSQTSIPEFQTLAIPVFSTIALMYLLFRQKQEK